MFYYAQWVTKTVLLGGALDKYLPYDEWRNSDT